MGCKRVLLLQRYKDSLIKQTRRCLLAPCKGKSLEYMLLYNQFYLDLQDECLLGVKILYEAFALTGRIADCECTQGAALG